MGTDATPGKVTGPASYFPSIEKTYGRPIGEWLDLAGARPADEKHMQTVDWLKAEFGMGHGHANAIVAYVRGRRDEGQGARRDLPVTPPARSSRTAARRP